MSSIRVSRTVLGFVLFALAVIFLLLFSSVRIAGAGQPAQKEEPKTTAGNPLDVKRSSFSVYV